MAVTDTTFRDAHQSLLATRVRTRDLLAVAGHVARTHAAAVVARGVGRGDVRRRAAVPRRGPVGAAGAPARGGAQHLPADAAARPQHGRLHAVPRPRSPTRSSQEAAATGIDVFRIFDALNDVDQMRPAIDAVRDTGTAVAEVALCYTGDLVRPGRAAVHARLLPRGWPSGSSTPARTCWRSRTWPACSARPPPARWSRALRERFDLPVHLHTHDTPAASSPRCSPPIDAGVDAVDAACAAMAGTTSQPALSALVAATDHTDRETGLDLRAVCDLEPYWEAIRRLYAPFESGLPSPTGPRLHPRDPRRAAVQPAPAGDRARARGEVRADRGHVRRRQRHPRQHRQGDAVVEGRRRPGAAPGRRSAPTRPSSPTNPGKFDVPDSVIGFLSGELGDPPGGWPEPFRTKALEGRTVKPRVAELTDDQRAGLAGDASRRGSTLNALLFPGPTKEFVESRREVRRHLGAADPRLPLRAARGRGARGRPRGGQDAAARPRGGQRRRRARHPHGHVHHQRPAAPGHRARPLGGGRRTDRGEGRPRQPAATSPRRSAASSRRLVAEGDTVEAGATVATIEAMKMEASITAPVAGTVAAGRARRHRPGRGRRPRPRPGVRAGGA